MNTISSPSAPALWLSQNQPVRPPQPLRSASESGLAADWGSAGGSEQAAAATDAQDNSELREAFGDFVGQTFYGQMLSAMRKTVDKPAYFHGGRAEEIFQGQLDQTLSEHLADATADDFIGPMFDLFTLPRR